MRYDPYHHRRRSIRLRGYDYTAPGASFLTVIVRDRAQLLGQIVEGRAVLSTAGQIVETVWRRMPRHFPRVSLDAFVIMPDHIHGIIVLSGESGPATTEREGRPAGTRPGSLSAVVQSLKSASTRRINQTLEAPGGRVWQEDSYECIVRDEAELERIRRYITANPSRWDGDDAAPCR